MDVVGAHLYVGGSWDSWVARCDWQLDVFDAQVYVHDNW